MHAHRKGPTRRLTSRSARHSEVDAADNLDAATIGSPDPASGGALVDAEVFEASAEASSTTGQSESLETRRGILRSVGGSAAAQFAVLPISLVLGIIVTRTIIVHYGEATYGQYILLVGIAPLIPFVDLGLSAAIMNATSAARDPRTDRHLRGVLVSCMRILVCCSLVVVLVALALYAFGLWEPILGSGLSLGSGPLAATLCLVVLGLNLLISFGQRILVGLGLNALVIVLSAVQTPLVLLVLWLTISVGAGGGYIAVASYAATLVISALALVIAHRRIRPNLGISLRDAFSPRIRGEKVFDVAWPLLIQMIALPLAMSSDRVVLSHLGTLQELTEYSLASQIFTPMLALISAAGMSLWPVFARARSRGSTSPFSPFTMSLAFSGLAVAACVALVLLSGWLADIASGGEIALDWPILITFSIFIVVQAAKYPFGTYLTDASGLRFQAYCVLLLLPLNLGLTIMLTPVLGAPGPIVGSIVGVVACQLVPNLLLVRRRMRQPIATNSPDNS